VFGGKVEENPGLELAKQMSIFSARVFVPNI
jgi:hypothetical protein